MSHHYVSWEQFSSGECCTHSWTRGSGVASGSLRPFGPMSGSNVARCSNACCTYYFSTSYLLVHPILVHPIFGASYL